MTRILLLVLLLVLSVSLTGLFADCGQKKNGSERRQSSGLTERQRDSTIAASKLPGANVVGRAMAISDSAEARAKRLDDGQQVGILPDACAPAAALARMMRYGLDRYPQLEDCVHPVLLYIASVLTALWGVAHLLATKGVVAGFGELTADNRRIITMEWIVEGVALVSTAAFVATATAVDPTAFVSLGVYALAVTTLAVLAVVSVFTGFRVAFLPFKLCPFILGVSAALIALGAWY